MTRVEWLRHIASLGLPLDDRAQAVKSHAIGCPECAARRATRRANRRQAERAGVLRSLGMTRTPYGWE